MLKSVQEKQRLATGSRGWLVAYKLLEVAHMLSMPKVEASCQLKHYRTKSTNWPFSYLAVKLRVQIANQLYFEKPDSSHSILTQYKYPLYP